MNADPLAQLRDIHLPPPVEFWPPAPGWWIVALLVSTLVAWLGWKGWSRWVALAPRRAALEELKTLETQPGEDLQKLREASALLRRLVRLQDPRGAELATLSGEAWLRMLDRQSGGNLFTQGPGRVLAEAPFRPVVDVPAAPVLEVVREWVRRWTPDGKEAARAEPWPAHARRLSPEEA